MYSQLPILFCLAKGNIPYGYGFLTHAIHLCRILFEVANLERSTSLKNEECLLHLADAVRMAYKTHQFAGGFNVDSAELFGKVKRLTQYYMRSMDPTWLKDTTKFSNSNAQNWDHVQRK